MNKFAILSVLFAVVAVAAASPVDLAESEEFSELQLKPDDDGEVAYLAEEHAIFADYCKSARDETFLFLNEKKKEGIASLFTSFFGNIDEVTAELQKVQQEEVKKVTENIMNTEEAASDESETDNPGMLKKIGGALAAYGKALAGAAIGQLSERIALLKSSASSWDQDRITEVLQQTCRQVQLHLQPRLQQLFKDAKADIVKSDPSSSMKSTVASVSYEKVGCITAGRVNKMVKVCSFLSGSVPMIMELAGK